MAQQPVTHTTSNATRTHDHEKIQHWIENRGGIPAVVEDTWDGHNGMLRVDFGEQEENLAEVSWSDFFRIMEESNLDFLYTKEADSRFNKFVERGQ